LMASALFAAGAGWAWVAARSVVDVAPILKDEPATTSVAYYPPLVLLALVLLAASGVLAVLGVAARRRWRASAIRTP
jgi:hypothetical protein